MLHSRLSIACAIAASPIFFPGRGGLTQARFSTFSVRLISQQSRLEKNVNFEKL